MLATKPRAIGQQLPGARFKIEWLFFLSLNVHVHHRSYRTPFITIFHFEKKRSTHRPNPPVYAQHDKTCDQKCKLATSALRSVTPEDTCPAPYDPPGVAVDTPTTLVAGDPVEVSTVTAVATGTPDKRVPREWGSANEASMPTPPAFTSRMEVLDWLGHPDWAINDEKGGGRGSQGCVWRRAHPSTVSFYL